MQLIKYPAELCNQIQQFNRDLVHQLEATQEPVYIAFTYTNLGLAEEGLCVLRTHRPVRISASEAILFRRVVADDAFARLVRHERLDTVAITETINCGYPTIKPDCLRVELRENQLLFYFDVLPKRTKLLDFLEGQQVELWTEQGSNPYRTRTIKKIDLTKKEVYLAGDHYNDYEDDVFPFSEEEFLRSLKPKEAHEQV